MARVLRFPDHGRLLVCTDLQGCMRDFVRMVEVFEAALDTHDGDAHLRFTGDLIPGPHIDHAAWPDFPRGASPGVSTAVWMLGPEAFRR